MHIKAVTDSRTGGYCTPHKTMLDLQKADNVLYGMYVRRTLRPDLTKTDAMKGHDHKTWGFNPRAQTPNNLTLSGRKE